MPETCTRRRGCTNDAEPPHSCPYQVEINDDNDPEYCTCCDYCRQECVWDI